MMRATSVIDPGCAPGAFRLLGIPGDTHATVSVFRCKLHLAGALTRTFRDPFQ